MSTQAGLEADLGARRGMHHMWQALRILQPLGHVAPRVDLSWQDLGRSKNRNLKGLKSKFSHSWNLDGLKSKFIHSWNLSGLNSSFYWIGTLTSWINLNIWWNIAKV